MHIPRLLGRLVAFASLVSLAGCMDDFGETLESGEYQIVGGQLVSVGAYPTVVALTDGANLCTATLVHPEWVLTAAHCVTPELTGHINQADVTSKFFVIFDDVDVTDQDTTGRTIVGLKSSILHPSWDPNNLGDNDVAVLQLATPVTDRVPTPIHRAVVTAGSSVQQVGYGVSDPATKTGSGVLRNLVTETTGCGQYSYSDKNLLCFDANDGDGTCFGDSGGPTFVVVGFGQFEVAGVTSFGNSELCTGLDASTHVAGELAFIDQYIPKGALTGELDQPTTIVGGCSVAHGRGGASGPAAAVLALSLLSLLVRRRRSR